MGTGKWISGSLSKESVGKYGEYTLGMHYFLILSAIFLLIDWCYGDQSGLKRLS